MIAAPFAVRSINTILLSDGREIHLDDVVTAVEGQVILDDVDAAIDNIESQLAAGSLGSDPNWRCRAETALKKKRRSRPRIQQRIAELRRAERQTAPQQAGTTSPADGRRKAFVDAARQMLDRDLFTEIWSRAEEMRPQLFANLNGGEP